MNITKQRLKQIIKEEMEKAAAEVPEPTPQAPEEKVQTANKLAGFFFEIAKKLKANKIEDLDMKEVSELADIIKHALVLSSKASAGSKLATIDSYIEKILKGGN